MGKKVKCTLNRLQENTGDGGDLDSVFHEGFTVGNGKTMYWYVVWSRNGNARLYKSGELYPKPRWVEGDAEITIHFK